MASSSLITLTKPFTFNKPNLPHLPNKRSFGLQRSTLRVNAIAKKYEPTEVVPQADRVLIRLEELPEKSAGRVLLPKSAVKFERYLMGEVVSRGAEVEDLPICKLERRSLGACCGGQILTGNPECRANCQSSWEPQTQWYLRLEIFKCPSYFNHVLSNM